MVLWPCKYLINRPINNIDTDALNTKKLNLKYGEKNTPILRDGFYIDQNGHIVVHTIMTAKGFQKGLKNYFGTRFVERWDE